MLLLLIAPYGFLGSCLLQTTEDTGGSLLPVFALFGVVLLCNMVYAFLLPRLGFDGRRILFWNLLLKLCNIPVYLFVFAVALVTNVLIIPMLPFLFLFDYALLLASTMDDFHRLDEIIPNGFPVVLVDRVFEEFCVGK